MTEEEVLGWNPYEETEDLGFLSYCGEIVTEGEQKYVTAPYEPDSYTGEEGDDTGLGRFAIEGYAQAGSVTGGGLLMETSSSYYKAGTAEEFLQALTDVKKAGKKAVIELTADIGLGSREVENFDSYSSVIKEYKYQPLTHPELKKTGVSVLMLEEMANLTIFQETEQEFFTPI